MCHRPWWCQDNKCVPAMCEPDSDVRSAESAFCSGWAEEALVVRLGDILHDNDAHFCVRSQGRGVVMLWVNADDFELIALAAIRALRAKESNGEGKKKVSVF